MKHLSDTAKNVLGPSWQVKILGWITAAAAYIALDPALVEFMPDTLERWVVGMAKIVMLVAGVSVAGMVKGSKVTGGSIPATVEAAERVEEVKAAAGRKKESAPLISLE